MISLSRKAMVIIFFVTGLVVGIWGFIQIMNLPLGKKGQDYRIHFDNVTGLTPADPITVKGIQVGRVNAIGFRGNDVVVDVWIEASIELYDDAHAQIKPLGMIGEKFIDLDPGKSHRLLSSDREIPGTCAVDLADSGDKIETLIQTTQDLISKMNAGLDSNQIAAIQGAAVQSIQNIETISAKSLNTMARLDHMIQVSSQLMDQHQSAVDSSLVALERTSLAMPSIAAKVDSLLMNLSTITTDLKNGRGTAGRLMTEDSLYRATCHTINQIDSLVSDFQKNPERYIKVSVF